MACHSRSCAPLALICALLVVGGLPAARAAPTACAAGAAALLTNGYFDGARVDSLRDQLVAATMANDAYPWARTFGFSIIDVVQGLTREQTARYQAAFAAKYAALGATSVAFADYYSPDAFVAGHAAVIGTPSAVFVVFRGTADLGQGWTSADIRPVSHSVLGATVQLYQAPYRSTMGVWPEVSRLVAAAAAAATGAPGGAPPRVYLTGHSLGGASACLTGLLLKEAGYAIGGVFAFGPYKLGTSCGAGEECWVSVYDRHLGPVTWAWWNNQDPIPALLDSALGTSFAESAWGHVPSDRGWIRVVGDQCLRASGTRLTEVCPPEIDAADGAADGVCSRPFVEAHLPWVYLQKVARCALLQSPREGDAARVDACGRAAVWEVLLGLPAPSGAAAASAAVLGRLSELAAPASAAQLSQLAALQRSTSAQTAAWRAVSAAAGVPVAPAGVPVMPGGAVPGRPEARKARNASAAPAPAARPAPAVRPPAAG
ncbi:hypothetical protein HT031_005204 [Scenedesmus sp. PABB004]|nr:hypothetical protein HT031_005204 [Scenedesmus sp. PABB004]